MFRVCRYNTFMADNKTDKKQSMVKKFQVHKNDTGSPEVQIALLSQRIEEVTSHLKLHKHDSDSRRGLLMMVGRRRRLLDYLKKSDAAKYEKLIGDLGLRR
jgi:small subunit ribosomal protein S15